MKHDLLFKLLNTVSVSGNEEENQRHAAEYMKGFADRIVTDPTGNVTGIINPDKEFSVMITGHMDEIGFRVTHITDEGLIRVQKAGGVQAKLYIGSPMQIIHSEVTEEGIVYHKVNGVGVITDDLMKKEKASDTDLLIDIGAVTKEEAEKAVSPGDSVCADTQCRILLNDCISSRALDDKAGAYVILRAAEKAAAAGPAVRIMANTAVGEETTGRGAYFAAARLKPDCAVAVDVTWASDCPGTDPGETGKVKLGGGPVLCLSGMVNKKMNRLLEETARELQIPVQYEVASGSTYTDGDVIMKAAEGIPMALVSIPVRYMHSSVEVVSLKDIEYCIELLSEFLLRIDETFSFNPLMI